MLNILNKKENFLPSYLHLIIFKIMLRLFRGNLSLLFINQKSRKLVIQRMQVERNPFSMQSNIQLIITILATLFFLSALCLCKNVIFLLLCSVKKALISTNVSSNIKCTAHTAQALYNIENHR